MNISDYPDVLQRIYKYDACNNYDRLIYDGTDNSYKITKMTPEGFAYIYLVNNEDDTTIIEEVKYTKLNNIKLIEPYTGSSYCEKVDSNTDKIILLKRLSPDQYSMEYAIK